MGIIKPFEFNYFQSECFITNKNILNSIKSNNTTKHIIYEFIDSIKKNTYRFVFFKFLDKMFDLTALEIIFNKLVQLPKENFKQIPYRLSKLTHYLKDSFGGNTSTLVFATIDSFSKENLQIIDLTAFAKRIRNYFIAKSHEDTVFANYIFEVKK
jgi:hypothetical protein